MARSKRSGTRGEDGSTPGSIHTVPQEIIIPQDIYSPQLKVEVDTDDDGTINLQDYVSEPYVLAANIMRRSINRGFGTATIVIDNPNGIWNFKITGGESIRVYADFNDASNQIFEGRIDVAQKGFDARRGYYITLRCRELSKVQDKASSIQFEGLTSSQCVKNLVDDWYSNFLTYTNLSTMSTIINRNYTWKFGHNILKDLFNKSGYYGYIDFDGDIHSFTEEKNHTEKLSIEQNCAQASGFGNDLQQRKNSIILTGDRVESGQNLYYGWADQDDDDIDDTWQRDLIINDSSITSQDSVETDASLILTERNINFNEGTLNAIGGLPTLLPAQSIFCSVPLCGINGWYIVHQLNHSISPQGWTTRVMFNRRLDPSERLFDTRDEKIYGTKQASKNPYGMVDVHVVTFEEIVSQIESFSTTEINDSTLRLVSGNSTGSAQTITKTVSKDIVRVELRVSGEDLGSSTYQISVDNGLSWETIPLNADYTVTSTNPSKVNLKVKWNLVKDSDNDNPRVFTSWCGMRFD